MPENDSETEESNLLSNQKYDFFEIESLADETKSTASGGLSNSSKAASNNDTISQTNVQAKLT